MKRLAPILLAILTVLFSATMPKPIVDITHKYQKDPLHIKADGGNKVSVPKIEQKYIELKEKTKDEAVCRLLEYHMPELAIVFCNMKKRVDSVVEMLLARAMRQTDCMAIWISCSVTAL